MVESLEMAILCRWCLAIGNKYGRYAFQRLFSESRRQILPWLETGWMERLLLFVPSFLAVGPIYCGRRALHYEPSVILIRPIFVEIEGNRAVPIIACHGQWQF